MPNIDVDAKAWELDLSARVGAAVQARRKAMKLTAVQLADRTAQLGYPISRVAVTKIETNARAGKVDVAELLVLAAALAVSPIQLLYPDLVDGPVSVLPNQETTSSAAAAWLSGDHALIPQGSDDSYGQDYFDGTAPLRLAARVVKARRLLLDLISNPQWEMGPGTSAFADAVNDLNNLKAEARRAGLVVEDSDG